MNAIGNLWNLIEPTKELPSILLGVSDDVLSSETIERLLHYNFSESGSNRYELEQETAFCFSIFLQKLEGEFIHF